MFRVGRCRRSRMLCRTQMSACMSLHDRFCLDCGFDETKVFLPELVMSEDVCDRRSRLRNQRRVVLRIFMRAFIKKDNSWIEHGWLDRDRAGRELLTIQENLKPERIEFRSGIGAAVWITGFFCCAFLGRWSDGTHLGQRRYLQYLAHSNHVVLQTVERFELFDRQTKLSPY